MSFGKLFGLAVIILLGAFVLSPAVRMMGMDPLPGDITLHWGTTYIYFPLMTSAIVGIALGVLFLVLKK